MDRDQRKTLIAQYKDGYRVVAEALAGATDEDSTRGWRRPSGRRARSCTTSPTAR